MRARLDAQYTIRATAILALAAASLFCGCRSKTQRSATAFRAGMVPGASLACEIDLTEARKAPIYATLQALSEKKEKETEEAQANVEKMEQFKTLTGLTDDDVSVVLLSANVDALSLDSEDPAEQIEALDGVLAIGLSKVLPADKLLAALEAVLADQEDVVVAAETVDGNDLITLRHTDPERPGAYVSLSQDTKAIFLTFSRRAMGNVLDRDRRGKYESIPSTLATVEKSLPEGAQMRLSFLLSSDFQQRINERVDKLKEQASGNPGLGMVLGFTKPLRGLCSLSLGTKLDEDMLFSLACDLGGESEAQQVSMLIQTIVLPMIEAQLAKSGDANKGNVAEKLSIEASGTTVSIQIKLDAADLEQDDG